MPAVAINANFIMPSSYLNSDISPEERVFIVTYIRALRREFWRLHTVMSLMDDKLGLAITDVTRAVELTEAIDDMHGEFEYDLKQIATKFSPFRSKIKVVDMPTVDQLADLFTFSFFKLVSIEPLEPLGPPVKVDNGWSSGQPGTLQTALSLLESGYLDKKAALPAPPPDTIGAAVFDLLSKLFNWQSPETAADAISFFDWFPFLKAAGNDKNDDYADDDYGDDAEDDDSWYDAYDSDSD